MFNIEESRSCWKFESPWKNKNRWIPAKFVLKNVLLLKIIKYFLKIYFLIFFSNISKVLKIFLALNRAIVFCFKFLWVYWEFKDMGSLLWIFLTEQKLPNEMLKESPTNQKQSSWLWVSLSNFLKITYFVTTQIIVITIFIKISFHK
jgi:hypothetical protein